MEKPKSIAEVAEEFFAGVQKIREMTDQYDPTVRRATALITKLKAHEMAFRLRGQDDDADVIAAAIETIIEALG